MTIKKTISKLKLVLPLAMGALLITPASSGAAQAAPQPKLPPSASMIQWETCPAFEGTPPSTGIQCGMVRVPLDYQNPNGEQIDIAVSRMQARRADARLGVMLLNPGGPGGVGLDMPLWMSELMPQSVLDRYDLIGFDPRGIGRSAPVSCGLTFQESMQIAPPLEQTGGFNATAAFMQRVANGCSQVSGAHLPYITTANTARDMDNIRQALGENKISYFGYSYGTYLAAVYASLFPNQTDRFVLDSATNARAAWREMFRSWGLADEVRFPDFANFLIANQSEYQLGGTLAEVRNTYFQLLDQVTENPIPLPDGTELDGPWFKVLSFATLYSDNYFTEGAEIWKIVKEHQGGAELQGKVNSLSPRTASTYPDVPEDNSGSATNAVLCDDSLWPRSVEQYRQEFIADTTRYPMFAALGSNIWPCAFWQNDPIEQPVPVTNNGPANILIVHNLRDPATPYPNGLEMRNAFGARARLVTVEQGGHGASYGEGNECAKETVTNYFVTGAFPAQNFTCTAESGETVPTPAEAGAIKKLRHRMW